MANLGQISTLQHIYIYIHIYVPGHKLSELWLQSWSFVRSSGLTHSICWWPGLESEGCNKECWEPQGNKQQEKEEEEEERPGQAQLARGPRLPPSKLADQLLVKWAWGSMSLPTIQVLAKAALGDGLCHPLVRSAGCLRWSVPQLFWACESMMWGNLGGGHIECMHAPLRLLFMDVFVWGVCFQPPNAWLLIFPFPCWQANGSHRSERLRSTRSHRRKRIQYR